MAHRTCPWWIGYFLLSPLRRLWQDPRAVLAPHVRSGAAVLEPGPGMGYFTLDLARLAGPSGHVVAVDVQPRMLAKLRRRAERAGLAGRIETRLVTGAGLGVDDLRGTIDFVLAFAVVHEVPDADRLFGELAGALAPGGRILLAEPRGHVSEEEFQATLEAAGRAGLAPVGRPAIRRSRAALLAAPGGSRRAGGP